MSKVRCLESMENVQIQPLTDGYSVLEFGQERFILSYDVIYELAMNMAAIIEREDLGLSKKFLLN